MFYYSDNIRFVFVKYANRGLVNDRYYYNANMTLVNVLFWISNICLFLVNQGNTWAHLIIKGRIQFKRPKDLLRHS